jgi:7,8-dihydroneopterin aldolase/epimerase/oxygenase
MDTIIIEQLRVDTIIGVHEWERSVKQTLVITVALACDVQKAAAKDSLNDAVDYVRIANRIVAFAGKNQFQLMETFAEQLAQLLLAEFAIASVTIDLCKPGAIAQALSAGIHIERSNRKK